MRTEKEFLRKAGTPKRVAAEEAVFSPTSVGVIIHTGHFDFAERRRLRSGEPEVLLVRQKDQVVNGFHPWGIPAGRVEQGEIIAQAMTREVAQETGISLDISRLRWFCPVGEGKVVFSYRINITDIPRWREAEEYELGVKVIPPTNTVNMNEIDKLALVPVEVFADHMLVGSNRVCRRKSLLDKGIYTYYPKSHEVDEEIDFVPVIYKSKIWQAIRHQMFARRIIPPYLG